MNENAHHNYRRFDVDGREVVFDYEKFKALYNNLSAHCRGIKAQWMRGISDRICTEYKKDVSDLTPTVRGWIDGKHGPSKLEYIYIIEDVMGLGRGELLKPMDNIAITEESISMREIKEYERNAARDLFHEMCELLQIAERLPNSFEPVNFTTNIDINNDRVQKAKYSNQEEYRESLILKIRQARFDVPQKLTDDLLGFVNDIFGPEDTDYNSMYLAGEDYKDYCEKNGMMKGNVESMYMFAAIFIENLHGQLKRIFNDYLIVSRERFS